MTRSLLWVKLERRGWFLWLFLFGWLALSGLVTISVARAECNNCSDLDLLLQAEETLDPQTTGSIGKARPSGISISVDGETLLGEPDQGIARIQRTDNSLDAVDIQLKFDGLDVTRRLNVTTVGGERMFRPGAEVEFQAHWNYPEFIKRAELRIYRSREKYSVNAVAHPLEIVEVPVSGAKRGLATWGSYRDPSAIGIDDGELVYSLRVYDEEGRYDETVPINLTLGGKSENSQVRGKDPISLGRGEDRTGLSNIPVYGGSVTVHGKHIPPGYSVKVLGQQIPLDDRDRFVTSSILPPGHHVVEVIVSRDGSGDAGLHFERDILIPSSEWFYVGLADLTLGKRIGPDAYILNQTSPEEFDDVYQHGRVAFYVKGKIKGETILTAAFDTTEDELEDLFDGLDRKDPRQLLRSLDPDDYYPVFGDDSTTTEDAPTSGKFYVRLQRGNSHVLWGNFKTRINGTELARFERGLYGAQASIKSSYVTSRGEPVAELEAFAAEPESLPQRDVFRGTGGSAYFLRRQDINQGSEQIHIERRNRITGTVIERTLLQAGKDYEIDYVQGVVILRRPLASTAGTTSAVRGVATGEDALFMVAVYEYRPTLTNLDGYSYGARGQAWINDHVRVGATGYTENTGLANQHLYGADVHLQLSDKSHFELEWAESEGDTFGSVRSTDGGFIFNSQSGENRHGRAQAYRAKLALELEELTKGKLKGKLGATFEEREAGFNAPGRYTPVRERLAGAFAEVEINEHTDLRASHEAVDRADGHNRMESNVEVEHRFGHKHGFHYSATFGIAHSDHATPIGSTTGVGRRTDIGVRLEKVFDEQNRLYAFGQMTAERDGTRARNDRFGAGVVTSINDKLKAELEASYGTSGIGGLAALNYSPNKDENYYLGYRLDPDSTAADQTSYDPFNRDFGSIVYGANHRLNDQTKLFFEENYDFSGTQRSLTHTYGVTYTPDAIWTVSGGFEAGEIYDTIGGDFDRVAVSGQVSLRDEVKNGMLRFEARFEDGKQDPARDRQTYLMSGQYGHRYNEDWRMVASLDAVLSKSDQSAILDGDFVEGSLGWAYRPVENDRLNALFRYTYFEDLPGPQQVNNQNKILGPRQRSHVLEGDFIYDLNERLSVGAKYGFRIGQIARDRSSSSFVKSSAHLAIARADFHVIDKWDLLIEARALWLPELDQTNTGYLAGIYRHIGENLKLGIGYNFGQFSDDLTDLVYDDEGIFLNVIGKF